MAKKTTKDYYSILMNRVYLLKCVEHEFMVRGYIIRKFTDYNGQNDYVIVGKYDNNNNIILFDKKKTVHVSTLAKKNFPQVATGYSGKFNNGITYDITVCVVAKDINKVQYFILNEDDMYNEQIDGRNRGGLTGTVDALGVDNLTLEQLEPYKNAWNKIK